MMDGNVSISLWLMELHVKTRYARETQEYANKESVFVTTPARKQRNLSARRVGHARWERLHAAMMDGNVFINHWSMEVLATRMHVRARRASVNKENALVSTHVRASHAVNLVSFAHPEIQTVLKTLKTTPVISQESANPFL